MPTTATTASGSTEGVPRTRSGTVAYVTHCGEHGARMMNRGPGRGKLLRGTGRSGHAGQVYMMTGHAGLLAGKKSTWLPRAVVARQRLPLAGLLPAHLR